MQNLYRHEAMEHASNTRRFGDVIVLRSSRAIRIAAAASIAVLLCLVILSLNTTFTRSLSVVGVLVPRKGLIQVSSGFRGRIAQRFVVDGQHVATGEPLFALESADEVSPALGDTGQLVVELLEHRQASHQLETDQVRAQARLRMRALTQRVANLEEDAARVDAQIALQRRRLDIGRNSLARYRQLSEASFISETALSQHEGDVLDQEQRLQDLERAKASTSRDLAQTREDLEWTGLQEHRDISASERKVDELSQELAERYRSKGRLVVAARPGTVTSILGVVGQVVGPDQQLAQVIPSDDSLEVEVYVPSRSIPYIGSGMHVNLRYAAFPYQKFGQFSGTVAEISAAAMPTPNSGT